ncbi:MAG: hypothetical protein CME61_03645 [Halobacteriovoraceae bacterium]|nr:hypothetical protein [Halobacteriovoraceae bacterium]
MDIKSFAEIIKVANTITLTTHLIPDPDGIGSMVALGYALQAKRKKVRLLLEEKLYEKYHYLDPRGLIHSICEKDITKKQDLFIVLDANSIHRVGERIKKIQEYSEETFFIDHHPCAPELRFLNLIDTSYAATGELVADLIDDMDTPLTKEIALALYTAILIDTSSFNYPTIKGRTHRIIAKLLESGISSKEAFQKINSLKDISSIHLLGRVLSRASVSGQVAFTHVTKKDLDQFNTPLEESFGLINHLIHLNDILVVCLFIELSPKSTKVSFRSFKNIDVGLIAQQLGGGGHTYSAATVIPNSISATKNIVIKKLDALLNEIKGTK